MEYHIAMKMNYTTRNDLNASHKLTVLQKIVWMILFVF